MNNNNSKGVSYTAGFFILAGLVLTTMVIVGLAALALLGSESAMTDPANAGLLRLIQVASVLLTMFLPAVLVAGILSRRPFQLLGYKRTLPLQQLGLVLAIVVLSLAIAGTMGYMNKLIPVSPAWKAKFDALETAYASQVAIMLNLKSFGGYLFSLAIMAFLPALCEETLFRGGLQNFLTRATHRPWLAILVVSILFSLAHFSFYGFLPRLFLGLMLGLIYHYTGNIWLSITAHFLNNALAVTQFYLLALQGKNLESAMSDDLPVAYWGLLGIPIFVLLMRVLKKSRTAAQAALPEKQS